MSKSPEELAHLEWLGYVQPVGLVVSIPALLEAQCYVNKNIMGEHARFLDCLASDDAGNVVPEVRDLARFSEQALDWQPQDLVEVPKSGALSDDMATLDVILPQYNETLRPTHVVLDPKPATNNLQPSTNNYILLIQQLPSGLSFDQTQESDSAKHWNAPPHAKFERLLRESGVPIGLLLNGRQFRLVYAPRGETSGYATFNVDEMAQVAGRPMFAAFQMLLGGDRLFNLADNQRLPHILANSRKYQNTVSTALAEQVTSALFELLRGFQAANDQRSGDLLRQVLSNNPQHVYHGLLTVLMRLVFVLYAEDRGLVSSEATYTNHYSVSGLFERLRSEAGRFPDTMDQRFGAWAQLLTLFRLVYEGGQHAELKIPARKGYLFDPDRYPFLEGRFDDGNIDISSDEEQSSAIQIPHISDGVIYRVLEDLLILDGERLSYRTLDVEQIGSVYEAIMGFELQVSVGKSIGIKPVKLHGAPAMINLEALLAAKAADRAKLLNEWTDQKLGVGDSAALKDAASIDEIVAALEKKIAKHVTPGIVPADSMVFQPSDERRRSGSHYTPRLLTQPIVRTTLQPILKQLCDPAAELPKVYEPSKADKQRYTKGEIDARTRQSEKRIEYAKDARQKGVPHPNQILDLKVCDPAMGSGAFLVETCRQLGDDLIKAWYTHDMVPSDIPPDEDEVLYARRTVAQRCLYGVDRNIMAVDLAKLSLWLVTLAKNHPFTFLDHALRHGDSIVGLKREQIIGFHWEPKQQKKFGEDLIQKRLDRATEARSKILNAREDVAYRDQEQRMAIATEALNLIRLVGDACVSCFFAADKKKAREEDLDRVFGLANYYLSSTTTNNQELATTVDFESRAAIQSVVDRLKAGSHPVPAFHWEIEFPEVFSRENGGFDAFVGNPPFLGGSKISGAFGSRYLDWILELNPQSHGNGDFVAYFFRGCFGRVRRNGTLGLIASNTIAQGDTRQTGLAYICENGGTIFSAERRKRWPGQAAVVVSVVFIAKESVFKQCTLDGTPVQRITAFLFTTGGNANPKTLNSCSNICFKGVDINGMGFTFDDNDSSGASTPIAVYESLLIEDPAQVSIVNPFIGGQELNTQPDHKPSRYVINFGDRTLEYCTAKWPKLVAIAIEKVKPERQKKSEMKLRDFWWKFGRRRNELFAAIEGLEQVLVTAETSPQHSFAFLPASYVYAQSLRVFARDSPYFFAVLQSRCHEIWARCFGSSMRDDLRYTPTDCFETFCFPNDNNGFVEQVVQIGNQYLAFRTQLMRSNWEGLTTTYNRFHSPDERDPGILELRHLHGKMDVAVLRAFDWKDLADEAARPNFCQFLLDYEESEDDTASEFSRTRQRKKPWRFRWHDDFRDEVLARLLELNEQRYKEELLVGSSQLSVKPKDKPAQKSKLVTKRVNDSDQAPQQELF